MNLTDFKIDQMSSTSSRIIPRGIRVTHVPSGLIAECELCSTQHKNRLACFEELKHQLSKIGEK